MILMPSTAAEGAQNLLQRLRRGIEALPIRTNDGRRLQVTVSCGLASYLRHALDRGALIRAADAALYVPKRAGRNRVTVADATVSGEPATSTGAEADV